MVCELVYAGPTEDFCQKWVFQRGEKKKYTEEGKVAKEGEGGRRGKK